MPSPESFRAGLDTDAVSAPVDLRHARRKVNLEAPGLAGNESAVALPAEPVPAVLGVPPVDAREGVEVLRHLPRTDNEMHQVVPAPGVGHHRGGTHVATPAAGFRYRRDGAAVGAAVRGNLFPGRLSVVHVKGLRIGGRIDLESVLPSVGDEGVERRTVQPVRSDVVGHTEHRAIRCAPSLRPVHSPPGSSPTTRGRSDPG